jgi:uncharacterized protein YjiK
MKWVITLLFIIGCSTQVPDQKTTIDSYVFDQEIRETIKLPNKLQELSGLAMTNDGRLFGHNDEISDIYQIDLNNGKIIKTFSVGDKTLQEDFEDLAIVNQKFYLVTAEGDIYQFEEGDDGNFVPYTKYKTKLGSKNDVEGLCYDPETDALLLACKGDPGKDYNGKRAVYAFSLSEKKLHKKPRFLIPIEDVNKEVKFDLTQKIADFFLLTENVFAPSGIGRHPVTGHFFIVSAQGRILIEISSQGKILGRCLLDKKLHPQPEGITFTPDLDLLIGDEGGNGRARITRYRPSGND